MKLENLGPWLTIHYMWVSYKLKFVIKKCGSYQPLKITFQSLSLKSSYTMSIWHTLIHKEYMLNFIEGIVIVIYYMIVKSLDHSRGYIVSNLWDITMSLLIIISIITCQNHQSPNPLGIYDHFKILPIGQSNWWPQH